MVKKKKTPLTRTLVITSLTFGNSLDERTKYFNTPVTSPEGIHLPEDRPSIKQPLLEAHHSKLMPLLDVPEVVTQQVAREPITANAVQMHIILQKHSRWPGSQYLLTKYTYHIVKARFSNTLSLHFETV